MAERQGFWRNTAWYSPIAIVGGALIGFFTSGMRWNPLGLLHGAIIGLFCFYGAIGGEALLHRWIDSAPKQWWRRALVYFFGGQLGWFVSMFLGMWVIWRQPDISADGCRITARNYAARYVAGDFCDVFQYGDGSTGIAVADVAGKGIAASLIMASVKAVLPLFAISRGVEDTMSALNEKLVGELSKREFVALALARFEPAEKRISFVNAGLPDPYVVRRSGAIEPLEVSGTRLPLGLRRGVRYEQKQVTLNAGDALIMFSDRLPEATTTSGEQLGYERLVEIIRATGANVEAIMTKVHAETSAVREDDQTIVLVECVSA